MLINNDYIYLVDELGRPKLFYCAGGCRKNFIHDDVKWALSLTDENKFHVVEPFPPEDNGRSTPEHFCLFWHD